MDDVQVTDEQETLVQRFRLALQLHDEGVRLMRQNLRRAHPEESEEQIDRRLGAWLADRPGAPYGDGVGRAGTWPRR